MLNVSSRLGNPSKNYYMWTWTHDHSGANPSEGIVWHSSGPKGTFTKKADLDLPSFAGYHKPTVGSNVVWDSGRNQFLTMVHACKDDGCDEQPSFVIVSNDGVTWTRLENEPVKPTPGGEFDAYGAGYGSFLHSPSGNVTKFNGAYYYYYRGTAYKDVDPGGITDETGMFSAGVYYGSNLKALNRYTNSGFGIYDPDGAAGSGSYWTLGSVIYNGPGWIPLQFIGQATNYLKGGDSTSDMKDWSNGWGTADFSDPGSNGANFMRQGSSDYVYYHTNNGQGDYTVRVRDRSN